MSEVKLVPARMLLDKETIDAINFHCGDGGDNFGEHSDGLLWIGAVTDDEGKEVYGLHLATAEYPEEGSTTLVEFAEPLDAQRLRADTAEAERDHAKEERDSYQRVGIAADERNAKLLAASKGALEVFESMIRNNCCGLHYPSVAATAHQLRAALNPKPEAESHES